MSFNSIYVNGSSFSCGNGLDLIEIKKIYKEKLNIEIPNHIDFSYPNIIASNFKTKIINEAVPGGSLNRLIRKTYQFIFDKKNISKNTLFILELPPMWRDEFYSNKLDRFINITWGTIKDPTKDLTNIRNGYDVSDILKIYDDLTDCFDNFINCYSFLSQCNFYLFKDWWGILCFTRKFWSSGGADCGCCANS